MSYDNDVTIAFEIVLDEIEKVANTLKQVAAGAIETDDNYDHALAIIEKGKHANVIRDKVSELQKEWNGLFSALAVLMPGEEDHPPDVMIPGIRIRTSAELSPRAKGKLRRDTFVEKLDKLGIGLVNFKGVTYKTRTGKIVGIASATEIKKKPDYWFLGLPIQEYAFIVLLCEKSNGQLLSFVLPEDFLQDHTHNFSRSSGQYKLLVFAKGNKHYIRMPKIGKIDISKYLDNIEPFR